MNDSRENSEEDVEPDLLPVFDTRRVPRRQSEERRIQDLSDTDEPPPGWAAP